jgi:hypothetical protein
MNMKMPQHHTQTIDGYRWRLYAWEDSFKARPQQRVSDEKGRVIFRNVGAPAYFDSEEKRNSFLLSRDAKSWAEKWRMPVMEYHHPALSDSS